MEGLLNEALRSELFERLLLVKKLILKDVRREDFIHAAETFTSFFMNFLTKIVPRSFEELSRSKILQLGPENLRCVERYGDIISTTL